MTRHILYLLFWAVATASASAQENPTPGQQLAIAESAITLPARAAWKITFSQAEPTTDSPVSGRLASSLEAVRVDNVQRDLITWPDGKVSEAWWFGKVWLAEDPAAAGILFNVARWPKRIGLASWINQESLKGIATLGDKKVILFEADIPLIVLWPGYVIPDSNHSASVHAVAWISLKEQKLERVSLGGVNADFTWLAQPEGGLPVTPRFEKRYEAIQKALGPELKGARN
jgi:hypothetical protein